jgi:hypothetical protein
MSMSTRTHCSRLNLLHDDDAEVRQLVHAVATLRRDPHFMADFSTRFDALMNNTRCALVVQTDTSALWKTWRETNWLGGAWR